MMSMRRTCTAILLPLSLLAACGTDEASDPENTIAVGFYPLEYVAQRVAGENYTVENLTNPGAEPHDLELGIQETIVLSNAALIIYESGFQPAVDASVEENAEGMTLDAAAVVDLEPLQDDHDHADEDADADAEGHDHGEVDPHFWQDPVRLAELGDAVAGDLTELDPDNADVYAGNAADLRVDLETLDAEYADGLSSCERTTVVVNHDAFGYLEKYGLEMEAILGLSPDAEPTAADLQNVRSLVDSLGITIVFSETLVSPKLSETLAGDLGIETGVLDPLEGLSDDSSGADYLSVMRSNLSALQQANGCR